MTELQDDLMKTNFSYPEPGDPDLQYKLYKKREFYYNKFPEKPELKTYEDIKEYRDNTCAKESSLHEYQTLVSNMINPDTPFKGCVLFHGLGTGKCIHGDSYIKFYKENRALNHLPISEIWDRYKTSIYIDQDEGIWSIPSEDIYVDSFIDENVGMGIGKVVRLYKEKVKTIVYKYTLSNSTSIIATMIHKFLILNGGYLQWSNKLIEGSILSIVDKDGKITFEKVISIEAIYINDFVYDLEIESYHNYVANNILCHNTCAGIAIAEKFKPLVQKYNTKIYILIPGPLLKEGWKEELISYNCTGETYMKKIDKSMLVDSNEIERMKKQAISQAMQYYKFMSYKSFYKRVLGEKIVEKKEGTKVSYRKNEEGEFERDVAVDRIHSLNNTLIIIDEAHNLTGNTWGDALMEVIKNSHNLKVLLLTGTPMKNNADHIVDLINFLRPIDYPMERDKIFSSEKNYKMKLKSGGLEYFKKMASGYISHVRGSDPTVFAKRIDKGTIPPGLLFTNVSRCKMHEFQKKLYDKFVVDLDKENKEFEEDIKEGEIDEEEIETKEDALDRKAEAIANFVFPSLSNDKKSIVGIAGNEGLNILKGQIKSNPEQLNQLIAKEFFKKSKDTTDLITLSSDGGCITGKILKLPYLKIFSTKFYKALKKVNRLYWGKKGPKTAFIYSNLVRVGIDIFEQILLQNGYLAYEEESSAYQLQPDTKCYYCGRTFKEHTSQLDDNVDNNKNDKNDKNDNKEEDIMQSISSTDYEPYKKHKTSNTIPQHSFSPATFIKITGKSTEEGVGEIIPEEKKRILSNAFNVFENREGKNIKVILGSKVMNEGISLRNIGEVHILDVYFNFGRVDQVIGRGIRWCSHYKLMTENNVFPFVNVYKYVVTVPNKLSSEEELYRKAELKYLLVKKIERAMKEVAIDCPLNYQANIFKEEIEANKDCNEDPEKGNLCPAICDYTKCEFKCDNMKLNSEFYDPTKRIYKEIQKQNLDLNTFTTSFARSEIEFCKRLIKSMYLMNHMYLLSDIISYVKGSYPQEKIDLFDEFFVYKALDELIPLNQNELNSYKDTIIDKNNRNGYLIFVDKYYIFQPYDQNEDVPIYYRTKYIKPITQPISLYSYLKNIPEFKNLKNTLQEELEAEEVKKQENTYDFETVMDYYDGRDENKYVGIIDKDVSRKKSQEKEDIGDLFKIREKRAKVLDKKRGTGIPSLKGAVCTTKEKGEIKKVANDLGVKLDKNQTRHELCDTLKNTMIEKEIHQTGDKKKTYMMIPANHPTYKFPLNLEDRYDMIKEEIKKKIPEKLSITKKKTSNGISMVIEKNKILDEYQDFLAKYNPTKEKDDLIILIN
jgi:superfamily II DNA or RNA helicase